MWLRWSTERHWPQWRCLRILRLFWMKLWEQSTLSKVSHCITPIGHTVRGDGERPLAASLAHWSLEAFTQHDVHSTFRTVWQSKIFCRLPLSDKFCDFQWLCKLAYSANIFSYLNGLSLSLQGKTATMFHVRSKIEATIRKLELHDWRVGL